MNLKSGNFNWTAEAIGILKRMWSEGESASTIAAELGTTRNTVIGKKGRLGLAARPIGGSCTMTREQRIARNLGLQQPAEPRGRTQKQQAADHSQRQRLQAATTRKPTPIRVIAREGRLVEPLNLPFGDLDDNQKPTMCRYPTIVQEGRQLFCARPAEHGTSYCDDCCRVVYTADGYERQINKAPRLRHPAIGQVLIAAPFSNRDYNVVGLVREVPFA
jgi:hypothetical protein